MDKQRAAQGAIVRRLLEAASDSGWRDVSPYTARHLASHASEARLLNEISVDPDYLAAADPERLAALLGTGLASQVPWQARVYLSAVHTMYGRAPDERAALLALAALQHDRDIPLEDWPAPWWPRWARYRDLPMHRVIDAHMGAVRAVASATINGRAVVITGGDDARIRVWDLVSGVAVSVLEGHDAPVLSVACAVTSDQAICASLSEDNTVRIWDLVDGSRRTVHSGAGGWAQAVTAFAVGVDIHVVSVGVDGTLRTWPVGAPEMLRVVQAHEEPGRAVAAYVDGMHGLIATASTDGSTRLWRWPDLACCATLKTHSGWVNALAISSFDNQTFVAAAGDDGGVSVWAVEDESSMRTLECGDAWAQSLTWIPGTQAIACGFASNRIKVTWLDDSRPTELIEGHMGAVHAVTSIEVEGQPVIVSGSDDGTVRIWGVGDFKRTRTPAHSDWVLGIAVVEINDTEIVVSVGVDQTVRLWAADDGEPLACLTGHSGWIGRVATVTVDGVVCGVTCGANGEVLVWNLETRRLIRRLAGHVGSVLDVAASSTSHECLGATAGDDGTVRVWDIQRGIPISVIRGHHGGVRAVRFVSLADRLLVASGGTDRTVRLWDPRTSDQLWVGEGHDGWIREMVFCSGRLISVGDDGQAMTWDLANGSVMASRDLGADAAVAATCGPSGDGPLVAAACADGTIRLWSDVASSGDEHLSSIAVDGCFGLALRGDRLYAATRLGICALTLRDTPDRSSQQLAIGR
jgi:WD40 repeat protein